jgi:hypothetical protein
MHQGALIRPAAGRQQLLGGRSAVVGSWQPTTPASGTPGPFPLVYDGPPPTPPVSA